jgi:predicted ribosomally synthesized peptide with SipW-like signal peptide
LKEVRHKKRCLANKNLKERLSMKRTKVLALVLAVAVMLMGAGYAAWTDKLEVNTTIDTGELSVRFIHDNAIDDYWASPRMYYLSKNAPGYEQAWNSANPNDLLSGTVQYSEKAMTFTFHNLYPGTRAAGLYMIENNGTIPAVIQNVDVTIETTNAGPDGVAQVADKMVVNQSFVKVLRGGAVIESHNINGISLAQLGSTLEGYLKGVRLQPEDTIVFTGEDFINETGEQVRNQFHFELPYDSLFEDDGEKETFKVEIDFDFVQHNMFDPAL